MNKRRAVSAGLALAMGLAALPATPACGGCNAAWFSDGLLVHVVGAGGELVVHVDADGASVDIPVSIDQYGEVTCPTGSCSARVDVNEEHGIHVAVLPTADVMIEDTRGGGPRVATVSVSREGHVLGRLTVEPEYQSYEPNGEGCGVHMTASAELVLSP